MRHFRLSYFLLLLASHWCGEGVLSAQGFGQPMTFQGLNHYSNQSAVSRALGGTSFGNVNDVSTMFSNPAMLQNLRNLQFSIGANRQNFDAQQTQQYSPLKYYSNFSLFMEGLTNQIPNPKYDTINHKPATAADSVQRPFDSFGPNWNRARSNNSPLQIFAALPFEVGGIKMSAGIGFGEYANLSWYYQNNNVLSPSILSPDAYIRSRPLNDADSSSIPVQWYQYSQQREGSIKNYGAALSVALTENMFLGLSVVMFKGSSDDREIRIERGRIRFYQNYFRAESVYYRITQTGTSDYNGQEYSFSGYYRSNVVGFGFSFKTPMSMTRTYNFITVTDSTVGSASKSVRGEDKMTLPLRGTLGLSFTPRENIHVNIEYELRRYSLAEYKSSSGKTSHPWLNSNVMHLGAEYVHSPWLTLRCGFREQAEVFTSEGSPLPDEPIGYTVFTGGAGLTFENVILTFAYEYSKMKYVDTWSSEVSINTETKHAVSAAIAYEIPW